MKAEETIRQVAEDYGRAHPGKDGKPRNIIESMSSFVGGGGPRFWFSVSPEQSQLNYAQILIKLTNKHDTGKLVPALQAAFDKSMVGAYADVQQLETGEPVGVPVSLRFSGLELGKLRELAESAKGILRSIPIRQPRS